MQYRITRVIGEGAFGTVYEGERVGAGLSRRVAMKLLSDRHVGEAAVEQRLRDEARMLSLVRHRAIVAVDDLIRLEDAWCIVMEFVDGADVEGILEVGPIPPRAALQIAEEVASALHAAQGVTGTDGRPLNLVHRDIKPSNIRLTPRGEVKLLDFGIARAEFGEREAATRAPGIGTVIYMAAERFRGEDTPAGDVYALGVTLFQMLVATPPGASAADADRRPPGRELREQWRWLEQLDRGLFDLILRMLADEPGDRPTARECARALAEARLRMPGELLEDWAERMVRVIAQRQGAPRPPPAPHPSLQARALRVGQTIGASMERAAPPTHGRPSWAPLAFTLGMVAVATVSVVAAVGWWWATRPARPEAPIAEVPSPEPLSTAPPVAPRVAEEASPPPAEAPALPEAPLPAPEVAVAEVVVATPPAPQPATPPAPSTGPAITTTSTRSPPVAPGTKPPTDAGPKITDTEKEAPPAEAEPEVPNVRPPTETPAEDRPSRRERDKSWERGRLTVSGSPTVVWLKGEDIYAKPGELPPGMFEATVTFEDGESITVRNVRVAAGKTTRMSCDAEFTTCRVSAPE